MLPTHHVLLVHFHILRLVVAHYKVLPEILKALEGVFEFFFDRLLLCAFVLQELWHELEQVFGIVTVLEMGREEEEGGGGKNSEQEERKN